MKTKHYDDGVMNPFNFCMAMAICTLFAIVIVAPGQDPPGQQPPLTQSQVLNVISSNIARDPGFFLRWASTSPLGNPVSIVFELQAFNEVYTATDGNARAKTLAVLESMTPAQLTTARAILALEVDVDEAEAVARTASEFEVRRRVINRLDSNTTSRLQSGRVPPS